MGRFSLKKATRQWLRKACRIMGQREMPIGIHAVPLSSPIIQPDQFSVRDRAMKALAQLGDLAEPALH